MVLRIEKKRGDEYKMKINQWFVSAGIGFAAGYFITKQLPSNQISAEKALHKVKRAVNHSIGASINGSWIHIIPETLDKFDLTYTVYRGGLSCISEGKTVKYDFIVDATTGTIVEFTRA
jgi:predicted small secreted protein